MPARDYLSTLKCTYVDSMARVTSRVVETVVYDNGSSAPLEDHTAAYFKPLVSRFKSGGTRLRSRLVFPDGSGFPEEGAVPAVLGASPIGLRKRRPSPRLSAARKKTKGSGSSASSPPSIVAPPAPVPPPAVTVILDVKSVVILDGKEQKSLGALMKTEDGRARIRAMLRQPGFEASNHLARELRSPLRPRVRL